MSKDEVVKLKEEKKFDTRLNVSDKHNVPTYDIHNAAGFVRNLEQTLNAGVEYAKQDAKLKITLQENILRIKEANETLEKKELFHDLENAFTTTYLQNENNWEACDGQFQQITAAVKKDKRYLAVANVNEIENFCNYQTTKHRIALTGRAIAQKNKQYYDLSVNEINTKQNELEIALIKLTAPEQNVRDEGFTNFCVCNSDIENILHRKDFTGGELFSEASRQEVYSACNNIMANCYARYKYKNTNDILDKEMFIRKIEEGDCKFKLKDLFKVSDDVWAYTEGGTSLDLGEFDFSSVDAKTRNSIAQSLRKGLKEEISEMKRMTNQQYVKGVVEKSIPKQKKAELHREAFTEKYDELFEGQIVPILQSQDPRKYQQVFDITLNYLKQGEYVPERLCDLMLDSIDGSDPEMFKVSCDLMSQISKNRDLRDTSYYYKDFVKRGVHLLHGERLLKSGLPSELVLGIIKKKSEIPEENKRSIEASFYKSDFSFYDACPEEWRATLIKDAKGRPVARDVYNENKGQYDITNKDEYFRQWRDAALQFYYYTGDITSSLAGARQFMKNKWGLSSINRSDGQKELMPYPVEDYYGNEINTPRVLRNKVLAQVKGISEALKMKVNYNDISVVADEETYDDIENKRMPSYAVYYKNEFGLLEDNIQGIRMRVGEETFNTEKEKEATGQASIERTREYLDGASKVIENGESSSWLKNFRRALQMLSL